MLDVAAFSYRNVDLPYRYNVAPRKVQKSCKQLRGKKWITSLVRRFSYVSEDIREKQTGREKEKDNDDDDDDDEDSDDDDSDESGVEKKTTTKSGFCRL